MQYLGTRGPNGTYSTFGSCKEWREAIRSGHYAYIFITTDVAKKSALSSAALPENRWMAPGKDSNVVLRGQLRTAPPFPGYFAYTLYKVDPQFSTDGCRGFTHT